MPRQTSKDLKDFEYAKASPASALIYARDERIVDLIPSAGHLTAS